MYIHSSHPHESYPCHLNKQYIFGTSAACLRQEEEDVELATMYVTFFSQHAYPLSVDYSTSIVTLMVAAISSVFTLSIL